MRPQAERRALSPHRIEQAPARVLERACPPCRRPRGYRPRGGRRPVSEPSTHSRAIRTGPHVRKPAERVGVRDVAYRRETRAHYPRSRDSVATVPTLNSRSGRRPDGRHPVVRVPPRTPGESASPPRARMHEPVARTRLVSCGPQSPSLAQDRRCASRQVCVDAQPWTTVGADRSAESIRAPCRVGFAWRADAGALAKPAP